MIGTVLVLLVGAFWFWMMFDFFNERSMEEAFWTMVVFFGPMGAGVYFACFYLPRMASENQHVSDNANRYKELKNSNIDKLPNSSLFELAEMYEEDKRYKDALICYEKALPNAYSRNRVLVGVARCHIMIKDPQKSVEVLSQIDREYFSKDRTASLLLCEGLSAIGKKEEALKTMQELSNFQTDIETKYLHGLFFCHG